MKSIKKEYSDRIEYQNEQGKTHRTDGPAIEWSDGHKSWWINNKLHREDGPAIEWQNGSKDWYLNDMRYSEEQWKQEVVKIKLKRILDL
jgi:hypothetical protein